MLYRTIFSVKDVCLAGDLTSLRIVEIHVVVRVVISRVDQYQEKSVLEDKQLTGALVLSSPVVKAHVQAGRISTSEQSLRGIYHRLSVSPPPQDCMVHIFQMHGTTRKVDFA